jgi:hypothetical protein
MWIGKLQVYFAARNCSYDLYSYVYSYTATRVRWEWCGGLCDGAHSEVEAGEGGRPRAQPSVQRCGVLGRCLGAVFDVLGDLIHLAQVFGHRASFEGD